MLVVFYRLTRVVVAIHLLVVNLWAECFCMFSIFELYLYSQKLFHQHQGTLWKRVLSKTFQDKSVIWFTRTKMWRPFTQTLNKNHTALSKIIRISFMWTPLTPVYFLPSVLIMRGAIHRRENYIGRADWKNRPCALSHWGKGFSIMDPPFAGESENI